MRERPARLQTIKRIIRNERINSQEQLLRHLEHEGFSVTQATLSRDLKLLRVGKISDGIDGYFYRLPREDERRESERSYVQDFRRGYVSLDFSGTTAVVHTLEGHADSVAIALDNLNVPEVLGTIAGNNTVFVVLREDTHRGELLSKLRSKVPDLEE